MGFSKEWEESYANNTHMSKWPWSDLVSYVFRYARPNGDSFTVLELGCGAGANIPFFKSLNVTYYALEGSQSIVKQLKQTHPDIADQIQVGDFTKDLYFDLEFDLIVDRGSLTHNATSDIRRSLLLIQKKLKKNGKFIGIDWFSTEHSDYKLGVVVEDEFTKTDIKQGHLADTGRVHFSNKPHILELFKSFNITQMEHKVVKREVPDDNFSFASWNFVAEKV
ncbi:bifunctional 2-polyprenyl-6-hydroxyphenol methylase/3-demethylubiquinol 3-O-methyltransferase UbiG [Paenibacillus sp. FSL H7-0331]|uniref:class I SAM-dependent methyltransferase n=1 Tax=Paenibacillus sp. FSL H7-0331 TaxID=1920421 RepID=UPI00096DCBCA|nr:class I SAM-dependent methyltransferase [Paenibacillus sp. FSL H7-0331]OMF13093.1 hypothetical protein BK127_21095 [Paenibacillus sp. FSL H7-0331]